MEHKKATEVLIKLLTNGNLNKIENEAVKTAIGVLSWTALAKSRMKSLKAKRERDIKYAYTHKKRR